MPDSIIFFKRSDALSLESANYYQDLLYRTVKIGTEIEFAFPQGAVREEFQPKIEHLMQPSHDMNRLGPLGVFDVVKEHCGVEMQIIGRHPQWDALVTQYHKIISTLLQSGARTRATCGLHFHSLALALSESIPEIILANIWNICRRFAAGLKFLTSAGDSRETLCRRRQNNAHQEFMRQSPLQQDMRTIQKFLHESMEVPEHQNFVNLEHVRFDEHGQVSDLHIEFRFPDAQLSAAVITAETFLFLGILLKAVEISKFGLLHAGDFQSFTERRRRLDLLSNNDGNLACSDTSHLSDSDLEACRQEARDALKFLKSIFVILDNPAEIILHALAEEPASLRKCRGASWVTIDAELLGLIKPHREPDSLDYQLVKIIEMGIVEQAADPDDWFKRAAVAVNASSETLRGRLEEFAYRKPRWDAATGRMLFLK
jgi:hypothetical protein